jgi:hypothetical protein
VIQIDDLGAADCRRQLPDFARRACVAHDFFRFARKTAFENARLSGYFSTLSQGDVMGLIMREAVFIPITAEHVSTIIDC